VPVGLGNVYVAAEGGHLEVLKWAREHNCPWHGEDVCSDAAGGGHLEVLQWARDHDCPWDKTTCECAAQHGFLEVVQWARAHGCNCDEITCGCAAASGNLELLRWVRENHCPWNELTCAGAAVSGKLDILQWARDHHCPWDEDTCLYRRSLRSPGVAEVGIRARVSGRRAICAPSDVNAQLPTFSGIVVAAAMEPFTRFVISRGPGRKPGVSLYSRNRLSLSLSHGGQGKSIQHPWHPLDVFR